MIHREILNYFFNSALVNRFSESSASTIVEIAKYLGMNSIFADIGGYLVSFVVLILILGFLILVHELGHFITAITTGMKVNEFSIGFGPVMFAVEMHGIKYSLRYFPLGGFVAIEGEDNSRDIKEGSFGSKRFIARFSVLIAGVTMNLIWAIIFFQVGLSMDGYKVKIGNQFADKLVGLEFVEKEVLYDNVYYEVVEGSLADKSEMYKKGVITSINNERVVYSDDISKLVDINAGKVFPVTTCGIDDSVKNGTVVIKESCKDSLIDLSKSDDGILGVQYGINYVEVYKYGNILFAGLYHAINELKLIGITLNQTFSGIFSSTDEIREASIDMAVKNTFVTPVGLLFIVDGLKGDISNLIKFSGSISLALAVGNLLPIPIADGGRIVLLIIDKVRGKKLPEHIEERIMRWSFYFLILLGLIMILKDLINIPYFISLFN